MKNTAKISLLLLLGAAQQGLETKPKAEEKKMVRPTAKQIEMEKKRVIYRAITEPNGMADLPRIALEWSSLPPVKDVTEAQVQKALHELEIQEEKVRELWKKRNDYLMDRYPVYMEEQKLKEALKTFWNEHKEELWAVCQNDMDMKELYAAQDKAQPYFWKYWQLKNQYNWEHRRLLPLNHRPYQRERELTPKEIQEQAKKAEKRTLAPGKSIKLQTLYSGNGTNEPERVINYSLALADGKDVSADIAILRVTTTTDRNAPQGRSASTYEYTVSSPRHAAPSTFYVLEHNLMGNISVYATVRITKGEDSVQHADKRGEKTSKPKKAVRKEIMPPVGVPAKAARQQTPPAPLVPVKAKHVTGKKTAPSTPAQMKKDSSMKS